MQDKSKIYRIIDVNLNRSREGLRVCEEVARFILNNKPITARFKTLRHDIQKIISTSNIKASLLHSARNVKADCGTDFSFLERKTDLESIFFANIQRTKESLRVLEEFFKLLDEKTAEKFKCLRFKIYQLEKDSR